MFKLGLTGSIATGKSTVLDMFSKRGFPTFCADDQVHQLYLADLVPFIADLYPAAIVDNTVNRSLLGAYLFENPDKLRRLENHIHPLVRKKFEQFITQSEREGARLAVADIPLLLENRADYPLDAIALTICSAAEQQRRALARPGMTPERLAAVLLRQMPQEEKIKRADFIIDTGGTMEQTEQQVADIIANCLSA